MNTLVHTLVILLLTTLLGCGNKANGGTPKNALLEEDRHVGQIYLGKTSLTKLKNKYGGIIQKTEDSQGSFKSLCLTFEKDNQKYYLLLMSGAIGEWDTVTEYDFSKVSHRHSVSGCGNYNEEKPPLGWIGRKLSRVIDRYGAPKKQAKNYVEYSFIYQEPSTNITENLDVYSGISFYVNNDSEIYRFNVFEVKSK